MRADSHREGEKERQKAREQIRKTHTKQVRRWEERDELPKDTDAVGAKNAKKQKRGGNGNESPPVMSDVLCYDANIRM